MQDDVARLLATAGRLLLEYNESTGEIRRTLQATARAISDAECDIAVTYGGVSVAIAGGPNYLFKPVHELRYNAALQARVHSILRQVRGGQLDATAALAELQRAEAETPGHPRWLSVLLLGIAAAALAALLGADEGAIAVSGVSTSLGLLLRQELGRRHFALLTLPFAASLVGALLGGLAIRYGVTHTPELVLIVPSLMLVPGPHLINGLLDLIDNYVPMSLARLTLATSILISCAIGIVFGVELTLGGLPAVATGRRAIELNWFVDMLLAGVVTIGFAAVYNTAWRHIAMATAGGMIGHGLRYLALQAEWRLVMATFVGGLAVGIVSAMIARSYRSPFAVIAFAGAVTMMPGLQIYRALAAARELARVQGQADVTTVSLMLGNAWQSCFIVLALALGLIVASRGVKFFAGDINSGELPAQ